MEKNETDLLWIKQQEKIYNVQENYFREPMDTIDIYFLYINKNKYIENILFEKHDLLKDSNSSSYLSKEIILELIQNKKKNTPFSKYKFQEILYFVIDTEPSDIQKLSFEDNYKNMASSFFKTVSMSDDISIPDSVFIFHNTNCLFFVFQEYEITDSHRYTLKSILSSVKNSSSSSKEANTSKILSRKNVRIQNRKTHKSKTDI